MPNLRSTFKLCPACEKRARLNHAQPARNGHFQIIPNLRAALPNCAQSARSGHFQVVPGSREAATSTLCPTLELHFHIVLNLRSTSRLCSTCELHFQIAPNLRSTSKLCPAREKRARSNCAQRASCASTLCPTRAALVNSAQPARSGHAYKSCAARLYFQIAPNPRAARPNCAQSKIFLPKPTRNERFNFVPSPREAGISKLCRTRKLRFQIVPNPQVALPNCTQLARSGCV